MKTLNTHEIESVGGGNPFAAVAAYLVILSYADEIGRGIGNGLYDAIHG